MKLHAIGDSWTCRESDTGMDQGWQVYALPRDCRHGVSGTTARQWALDQGDLLSTALSTTSPGDTMVVSLLGNDIRKAESDSDGLKLREIHESVGYLSAVVNRLHGYRVKPVLLLYADPYMGRKFKERVGVTLIRTLIRWVAWRNKCETFDTADVLTKEHFDGKDIHPTQKGHHALAAAIVQRYAKFSVA